MPPDGSFMLGPFAVDANGAIALASDTAACGFRWRGRAVWAQLRPAAMALSVALGRIPSTARDAASRPALLAVCAALVAHLPPGWRLALRADHRLDLAAEIPVAWPLTATELLTASTGFLLALAPYLDVLEAAGVAES